MAEIEHNKVEVVIAGSGIAGSTMAAELGEAGFDVLVLEAGPERKPPEMVSSQIWSRRLRWAGPEVDESGDLVGAANFAMGWGTGGAGLHWYANWYRLHPDDFHVRSLYGRSLDWPLSYEDLRPWYDHAQRYFGISGDPDPNAPSGADYPMAAIPISQQSAAIKPGFQAEGLALTTNTLAVNSVPYDGRTDCKLDGWCDAGCPIGALANPLVLQWPRAKRAGVRLRHEAYVSRVECDDSGQRATGVTYLDAGGRENFQPADLVISACHTIWNARLLLLSACDRHPDGLGNANTGGALGRYFTSHALTTIHGLFPHETEPHRGVAGANSLCLDGYDNKEPAKGAFGSRAWLVAQAAKPNDLLGTALAKPELFGAALEKYLQQASRHFGQMTVLCEEDAVAENRITLDHAKRDRLGLPQTRVANTLPPENAARADLARAEGLRIFKAAGSTNSWAGPRNPMHMIGGTVMGDDPAHSVTDGLGRVHGVENLFVAGASLFPTPGAINPTATLAALVFRTADHIRDNRAGLLR